MLGRAGLGPSYDVDCGCGVEDGVGMCRCTGGSSPPLVLVFKLEAAIGGNVGAVSSPGPTVGVPEGNGENGASPGLRFIGGRPRILTPPSGTPGLHAEDTFLGPRRWDESRGFEGVTADRGSSASSQNEFLVVGVIADCGHRVSGICWTVSLGVQGALALGSIGTWRVPAPLCLWSSTAAEGDR